MLQTDKSRLPSSVHLHSFVRENDLIRMHLYLISVVANQSPHINMKNLLLILKHIRQYTAQSAISQPAVQVVMALSAPVKIFQYVLKAANNIYCLRLNVTLDVTVIMQHICRKSQIVKTMCLFFKEKYCTMKTCTFFLVIFSFFHLIWTGFQCNQVFHWHAAKFT